MEDQNQYTDLTYLNEISGGDKDFINEIVELFLNQMPQSVQEMKDAYDNDDPVKLGEVAHKAKPSAIYVGNKELETKLKTLQELKEKKQFDNNTASLLNEVEQLSQHVIEELKQNN